MPIFSTLKVRPCALMRSLVLFASVVLLLLVAGLPFYSEAQADRLQLGKMWSGVLSCAKLHDTFIAHIYLNGEGDGSGDSESVPVETSVDHFECGEPASRKTSSRTLVDTFKNVFRKDDFVFDGDFRLDSGIGRVWDRGIQSDAGVAAPLDFHVLSDSYVQSFEPATLFQPGSVFWSGFKDDKRADGSIIFGHRQWAMPDMVASGFPSYARGFERGYHHSSPGVDVQSRAFQAAGLNYSHPFTEWGEVRIGHEHQALREMDLRVGLASGRVRLDPGLRIWAFEGATTKKPSPLGAGTGMRVFPEIFFGTGYANHDPSNSID